MCERGVQEKKSRCAARCRRLGNRRKRMSSKLGENAAWRFPEVIFREMPMEEPIFVYAVTWQSSRRDFKLHWLNKMILSSFFLFLPDPPPPPNLKKSGKEHRAWERMKRRKDEG